MKNAMRIYSALLKLYPRSYRSAFGVQMLQTFIDHHEDVEKSEGSVGAGFWLSVMGDEIRNIAAQHLISVRDENSFLKLTGPERVVSALLLVPLGALFYAALVGTSLALPHPPLTGISVLVALAVLLLLSGLLSLAASYILASVLVGVSLKRPPGVD